MSSQSIGVGSSSNFSGSNDFVKKLFQMLQEDDYKDVVRWTSTGDSFVVLNTNEFTKEILPRHFKHSNFASFVRQLNKYDFHKVKVSNEDKSSYPYGEDAWEFKHPDFRINDRDSLENIKRKGPTTKKGPGASNGSESTSDLISHPQSISSIASTQQYMKEQLEYLQADNKALHQEIGILHTKYKTIIESIVALNTVDERYHRSMGVLVNSLLQAGIKLPPLDFPNPSIISLQHPQHNIPAGSVAVPIPQPRPRHSHSSSLGNISTIPSPPTRINLQPQPNQPPVSAPNAIGATPYIQPLKPTPPSNDNLTPKPPSPLTSTAGSPTMPGFGAAVPGQPQLFTTNLVNPKFHVLLVEDDNVCIQLCRKFLVKYGCQVTVVTDGLNAISTVEHTRYDLILMDIVMPNLDGATAASVIRSFDTKTPIIAMTGNIEDNDLVNYLQNGMSDILAKPFTKDDLYSILAKHLLTDEMKAANSASASAESAVVEPTGPKTLDSPNLGIRPQPDLILPPNIKQDPDVVVKKQRLS